MPRAALLCAVILLTFAGCGGEERSPARSDTATAPAPGAAGPALCTALRARVTGRVAVPAATELSGLVRSRSQAGVLWTHNDSGDGPRAFALTADGARLGEVAITGAQAVDWEDIAATPRTLYLGDIGDNAGQRAEVVVYRVPEPRLQGGAPATSEPATAIRLRYPDGPHDAEALLADATTGALVIVTKSLTGSSGVYVAPAAGGALRRTGTLDLGLGQAITAGDVSGDGRTIALRSYDRAYVWRRGRDESIARALRRAPCSPVADLLAEGQGETLALAADGRSFMTVPEGGRAALRRYARPRR